MRRREWILLLTMGDPHLGGGAARAFRGWFCWLAETVHHLPLSERPAEVKDCSSLARFAYREALRKHDAAWLARWRFPAPPPLPEPPSGIAPLFRVNEDPARHFADAAHLMRHNTAFVARRWESAQPGDLFFFRQAQTENAFHMMVFLGPSLVDAAPGPFIVYHTGPSGPDPGEMRRPLVADLLQHPEIRWRPSPGNPAFLGVFRWNLLNGGIA
jgi:uncharacterized protein YfaT (DUF1175 family)